MDSRQTGLVFAGILAGALAGVIVGAGLLRREPERAGPVRVTLPPPERKPPPAPRVPPPPLAPKEPPPAPEPEKHAPAPPPQEYLPRFKYCQGFPAPEDSGYLRNSSFEGWKKRGAPSSWDVNELRQLGYRIESRDVHDGERCLKVIDRSTRYQGKMWQHARGAEALAGKKVRFSVWVKLLKGPKVVDYLSIFTPETDHFFNDDPPVTPGEWQEVSVERRLPAEVSKVVVYVSCFSSEETGEMLVDAARFEVVEE